MERLLGVPPAKVAVLPNGIDPEELDASTPKDSRDVVEEAVPQLKGASPLFLSVGRLEAYKGFGDVLTALASIERSLPPTWGWVIVGQGPERDALEGRVSSLAGRVHLLGRAGERLLHALYASADVFVHATRYEGSSLVTLEAMAHGLPVIATRAGGIPDKVVDGVTGVLVDPGDTTALAAALARLGKDEPGRRRLGAEGRARALQLFSWRTLAGATLKLYEELLAGARA